MLQIGLLAADLLEDFLSARLIKLLVAIETIPGIPQNFACVRYVAELPGQFGQAHFVLDDLLFWGCLTLLS